MRSLRTLPFYLAMLSAMVGTAQIPFGVKDPGVQTVAKCGECLAAINSKPKEVQFGLFDDPERNVWFVITDARFIEKLMKQGGYGFSVDVVSRD